MGEILKNVGIGWLTLVISSALGAFAVAVSLHGQVRIGPLLLPLGILVSPGAALLLAGIFIGRRARDQAASFSGNEK